jgi:hypothetical protein
VLSVCCSQSVNDASYVTIRGLELDGINLKENRHTVSVFMPHVTIENMVITNAPRNGIYAGYNPPNPTGVSNHITIRNNTITKCGRLQPFEEYDTKGLGIYIESPDALVEGNVIDGCRAGGLAINHSHSVNGVYRNNIIRNAGLLSPWGAVGAAWSGGSGRPTIPRGIGHGDQAAGNQVYNNVVYNIKGTGSPTERGRCFAFGTTSGLGGNPNKLWNNTCYNADVPYAPISCGNNHQVIMQNNVFVQTTSAAITCGIYGTITNNLTNPSASITFVNAAGGDFQLKSGSAAVDAGLTIAAVRNDYNKVARPQGAAHDIGAFEYVGQPTEQPFPPQNFRMMSN